MGRGAFSLPSSFVSFLISLPSSFAPLLPFSPISPSLLSFLPSSLLLSSFSHSLSWSLSHSFCQNALNSYSVWDSMLIMIRKTRLLSYDTIQLKRHWLMQLWARCWRYWVCRDEHSTDCDLRKRIVLEGQTHISLLICLFTESLGEVLGLLIVSESITCRTMPGLYLTCSKYSMMRTTTLIRTPVMCQILCMLYY